MKLPNVDGAKQNFTFMLAVKLIIRAGPDRKKHIWHYMMGDM